jgi:hypothetical protein
VRLPLPLLLLLLLCCDAIMPTQYHHGKCQYMMDECLIGTQPQGVMECWSK